MSARFVSNPFRPTRWEHHREGQHLIWYSALANKLAAEKSIYVSGSRGSGKTTLLRSICWEDLVNNTSLRMQKKLSQLQSIGCYIRFPDHLSSALASVDWGKIYENAPNPDLEHHRFFSLLVELTCAERAIHATHELRVAEFANVAAKDELALSHKIFLEFPKLKAFTADEGAGRVNTLSDLCRLFRLIAREMNQSAARGLVREINDRLPAREPGQFLAFIVSILSEIITFTDKTFIKRPGFKFCLDDCEVLNTTQQISINTLVRICKHPMSWVVSYVGSQFENSRTYIEQQTLSDADRLVESLDLRNEKEFKSLCQAVAGLRLMFDVSDEVRIKRPNLQIEDWFSIDQRLGSRSVNDLIDAMIRRSVSPVAKRLKTAAEQLQQNNLASIDQSSDHRRDTPPYYEAYVLLHWVPSVSAFKTEFSEIDEQQLIERARKLNSHAEAAWLRRKQRGALLHLASRIGLRTLPLAGGNVVLSLADGSIRDFLEILGSIYEVFVKNRELDPNDLATVDRFTLSASRIAYGTQTEGIYSASRSYHQGVSARSDKDFDVVLRLIEGLGHYTAILQSDHTDPSVLSTAERGVFNVRFESADNVFSAEAVARERIVWNTIRQAELAGYVRTIDVNTREVLNNPNPISGTLLIRLHRRFSPYFRFSFRGPYEVTTLLSSDLWNLCDRQKPIDTRSWAENLAGRVPLEDQGELTFQWTRTDETQ